MGQLFALSCLMHMYGLGFLSITEIPLDAAPIGDRQRERNSRVLSNVMDGVVAEVDLEQRGAEGDGHVQWDFALPAITTLGEEEGIVYVDPGTARLEIGHTDTSNTCLHLARFGAIARWPYEQEFLGILAMRPRNVISTWRSNRPARAIFADFAEFTDIMATTRLSRPLAQAMLDRPSAEERLFNARVSFGDIEELGKLVEKPDRLDCVRSRYRGGWYPNSSNMLLSFSSNSTARGASGNRSAMAALSSAARISSEGPDFLS